MDTLLILNNKYTFSIIVKQVKKIKKKRIDFPSKTTTIL